MSITRPHGKELYEKEKALLEYQGLDRIVSSEELSKELDTSSDLYKIQTGLPSLDKRLDGVEAGELIVVTGPPGHGKTTLLMSITQNISMAKISSVWFTLEVTPRQFLNKLTKKSGEIPQFFIPRSSIDDADSDYVKNWEAKHKRKYLTLDWLEDRILEAKVKHDTEEKKLQVVFIDHIHMIFSLSAFTNNISLEIGDMVAKIKDIALQHNLVIFLIAHCKDPQEGTNREPRMSDIRDSGLITRLADTVLGVWRIKNSNDGTKTRMEALDDEDNRTKVQVFKNRREGKLGFFTAEVKEHYLTEEIDFAGL